MTAAEQSASAPRPALRAGMRTFFAIWGSQLVSVLGSGLTSFGLGVWIFSETRQATPFALTVLFGSLPRVLLSPIAGTLADRWDRRKLMLLADTADGLVTLVAAGLFLSGRMEVWMVYLLALFSSIFSTFQSTAYSASVVMLVPKEQLGRANGLLQLGQALENLVSPLLAGALFGWIGLGGIMVLDVATFTVAVVALLIVRIPQPERSVPVEKGARAFWQDAAYGWHFLTARPGLFGLLGYFALVNFLLNIAMVLIGPLILSTSTSVALGAVQMAAGAGMLVGSVIISAWGGPRQRIRGVLGFIAVGAAGMAIMGLHSGALVPGVGMFFLLLAIPMASACSQGIFQTKVPSDVQGRVFAIRGMISQSMMPLAFLLAGPLADRVFEPLMQPGGGLASSFVAAGIGAGPGRGMGLMFTLSGLLLLVVTALVWTLPRIRNVESELPEVVFDN
jgi:MFS transporter, DHA3 family, macrolide efflux protein